MTLEEIVKSIGIEPYYYDREYGQVIYCADCREILPLIPDKSIDLVLTDPPYGIGAHSMPQGHYRDKRNVISEWDNDRVSRDTLKQVINTATNQIIWGGNYMADILPRSSKWLIWDKMQVFSGSDAELAWTSYQGALRIFRLSRAVAYCGFDAIKGHPTQKPRALMKWCIIQAGKVETILDPFMGSGSVLVACKQLNRKCIGAEIEERYCEIAVKRLSQSVMRLEV